MRAYAISPINAQLGNLSYVVCAIVGGAIALIQYLGFTVGGTVKLINVLGENVIVKVKESRIAIGADMARRIMV